MMIEQERTFYVGGVPVSWYEINDWWQKLREKDKSKANSIGDPYWNEKTCWYIANEIVGEIEKKIHGKISNHYAPYDEEKSFRRNDGETYAIKMPGDVDVDWHDASAVFKKALEDAEARHKEKLKKEEDRKKQAEYERYRHQQALNQSKNNYTPPPPPPKPKELDWREILHISYGVLITENMIKNSFRKQVMICHPDKGGTTKQLDELFQARDLAYRAIGLPIP
jgi:hypothetical protein